MAKYVKIHGYTGTSIHMTWLSMLSRCNDEKAHAYDRYGGRGIKVCERWRVFINFLEDMGERPGIDREYSLDRIDNSKGYYRENCRWATKKEQANNRRNNTLIEYKNEILTVSQWADKIGITSTAMIDRLRKWSKEKALTCPKGKNRKREKFITLEGETKNIAQWAKIIGLSRSALRVRLKKNWPLDKTLLIPKIDVEKSRGKDGRWNSYIDHNDTSIID